MPLALFLVPSWAGQCCHCLLDARVQGASPFWNRYPRPLEGVVCSQSMFRAGFLANCCRCEGEFEDKIKGSAECFGLFDVLLIRNNYPAQPLLPSCSLQSTRRSGRTKGKGRT